MTCAEEQVPIFATDFLDRYDSSDAFARSELKQIDDRCTAGLSACLRDLVHLKAEHAATVREKQHVRMRARDEQMLDEVFITPGETADAATTAMLAAVVSAGSRLM